MSVLSSDFGHLNAERLRVPIRSHVYYRGIVPALKFVLVPGGTNLIKYIVIKFFKTIALNGGTKIRLSALITKRV